MNKLRKDYGVRALLATIVIGGAVIGGLYLVFTGSPELGMGFLSSAAMGALGFYFGSRGQPPQEGGSQ
jgi:hypothetical protein